VTSKGWVWVAKKAPASKIKRVTRKYLAGEQVLFIIPKALCWDGKDVFDIGIITKERDENDPPFILYKGAVFRIRESDIICKVTTIEAVVVP
jgi:hypothetical protein